MQTSYQGVPGMTPGHLVKRKYSELLLQRSQNTGSHIGFAFGIDPRMGVD